MNADLSYYNWIIACEGEPVASMDKILGREIEVAEVEDRIERNFRSVFEYGSDTAAPAENIAAAAACDL